jgi:hypothetical protein
MRQAPWFAVVVVLALGCDKKKEAAPPPPAMKVIDAAVAPLDAAVPTVDAPPPPLTPPPGARGIQLIDLQYGGFVQPGLPAMKDDGSEIVATSVGDDGGRGYLDLSVVVLDGATGRVRNRVQLADPNETSDTEQAADTAGSLDVENALFAKVRDRVKQANSWVTTGAWRTLAGPARSGDAGPPEAKESLTAGDLTFTYDLARQVLSLTRADKQVASHRLLTLMPELARSGKRGAECPGDLDYLRAVYPDVTSKRVLVEIGMWSQGHNCGARGQRYVVIPLP